MYRETMRWCRLAWFSKVSDVKNERGKLYQWPDLKRIQEKHNGCEYQCDICLQGFSKKFALVSHKFEAHDIVDDTCSLYTCKIESCYSKFMWPLPLASHIAKAHKIESVSGKYASIKDAANACHQCEQCERVFQGPKKLREHVDHVHKKSGTS